MVMRHLDLFSGIGGFAYAADQVFGDVEHIFCDNDKFCQQVLKKHWPEAKIYGDIRTIATNPKSKRWHNGTTENKRPTPTQKHSPSNTDDVWEHGAVDLLTGGFPCQPFSAAGLRRGTADERHLWPEMLRIIQLVKPTWVIAENVRGLVTWNDGLVLEQVCADLETAGYEVQPLIIPAVAVNAPHRRDRIWFIGHAEYDGQHGAENPESGTQRTDGDTQRPDELRQPQGTDSLRETVTYGSDPGLEKWEQSRQASSQTQDRTRMVSGIADDDTNAADTRRERRQPGSHESIRPESQEPERPDGSFGSWERNWPEVAAELCSVDDGLPVALGGFELSKSRHRKEQLKAYGNAIVPQVAMEIMKAIKGAHNPTNGYERSAE